MNMMEPNYTVQCFPSPFSLYHAINKFNLGFPAQFLITSEFAKFPSLQTILYVFVSFQIVFSMVGIFLALGRTVDKKRLPMFVQHKIIVLFNSTWQLALGGLIVALPTQWLSNITMGMILYHSWSEFFALILRLLIVTGNLNKKSYDLFWKWAIIAVFVSVVPFMLGYNPYIQGIISVVFVVPADFLNLFVAPYLTIKWMKISREAPISEKVSEVLIGSLSVFHVIFFYGQGLLACLVSVEVGAKFFVAFQVISTVVYGAAVIAYIFTIRSYNEWESPLKKIASLFRCHWGTDAQYNEESGINNIKYAPSANTPRQ